MLNKLAATFADSYHQRISMYEVRPDFFYFSLFNPHGAEGKHAFFFFFFKSTHRSVLPGVTWVEPELRTPELKSMALFCLFVIVSVR